MNYCTYAQITYIRQSARYIETLLFGNPDKIPFQPGDPREPSPVESLPEMKKAGVWINHDMNPWFEEKVIEKKEHSIVAQPHQISVRG